MKKTIVPLFITALVVLIIVIGCQSSADKVLDAKADLTDAKKELIQTRKDSIQQWKEESQAKISHYEKSIAEFKAGMANEKREIKASYEMKIATLEEKNMEMKMKLEDFKEETSDQWTSFKNKFNHDMEEFGAAFNDLTVKNVK